MSRSRDGAREGIDPSIRRLIMPFDNAPERAPSEELSLYERLKILRELVPKSGNQGSWSTCLWSVARRDKRLRAAGLAQYDVATGMGPRPGVNDFFGGPYFWGAARPAGQGGGLQVCNAGG